MSDCHTMASTEMRMENFHTLCKDLQLGHTIPIKVRKYNAVAIVTLLSNIRTKIFPFVENFMVSKNLKLFNSSHIFDPFRI